MAIRDWTFNNTTFNTIYSYMPYDNIPSIMTAISYGCHKDKEYFDEKSQKIFVYSIKRKEWEKENKMNNPYINPPVFENDKYLIRLIKEEDIYDLWKVYKDKNAVLLFNDDGCNDNFYYDTFEKMQNAMKFWIDAYKGGYFIRFTIIDKINKIAIGTIEIFVRESKDIYDNSAFLRLDLRSDYEETKIIEDILNLLIPSVFEIFNCLGITTKAFPNGVNRKKVLESFGFVDYHVLIYGSNGQVFSDYVLLKKK